MPKQNDGPSEIKSDVPTDSAKQSTSVHKQASGKRPEKESTFDPLVRNRTYPEPHNVFAFVPVKLKEALRDGVVAIDTNALVLPYGTGANSLKEIRTVYAQLAREKKLRIPGQVA